MDQFTSMGFGGNDRTSTRVSLFLKHNFAMSEKAFFMSALIDLPLNLWLPYSSFPLYFILQIFQGDQGTKIRNNLKYRLLIG